MSHFSADALSSLIDNALAGGAGVHVVVAPPGEGKSTLTRAQVVELLRTGQVSRVLWATQATRDHSSLGREALEDFRRLQPGLDVDIIYGREYLQKEGRAAEYEAQFTWPAGPAVRIISHAHLPLIFAADAPQSALNTADLLICDEDPIGALLVDSLSKGVPIFTADGLLTQTDPTAQALGLLLREAESGNLQDYEAFSKDVSRQVGGLGLYGAAFWRKLRALMTAPHDSAGFEQALRSLAPRHPQLVRLLAQTFADDLETARLIGDSLRFGVHGVLKGDRTQFRFRYNLRHQLHLPCPTLVLDAYASPEQYQALFMEQAVQMHTFTPRAKLEVEHAPRLKLDAMDEGRQRRLGTRRQITEELLALFKKSASPGQLIITPSRLTREGTQWQKMLKETYVQGGAELGKDAVLGYWFAGRGKNEFQGRDVIALTAPHLPKLHRTYTLSALFPLGGEQQAQLQLHLEGTELLQLLHRGRQTSSTIKPRVIAADVESLDAPGLAQYVTIRPYKPLLAFTKRSQMPRQRDAMQALASEVLDDLGGVPREVLQALEIVMGNVAPETLEKAQRTLDVYAGLWSPSSALWKAIRAREEWEYGDVKAARDNSRNAEKEVMARLGLREFPIRQKGQNGKPLVYAPDRQAAELAYLRFQRLKGIVHEEIDVTLPEESPAGTPSSRS